jgi:hypothetical protein
MDGAFGAFGAFGACTLHGRLAGFHFDNNRFNTIQYTLCSTAPPTFGCSLLLLPMTRLTLACLDANMSRADRYQTVQLAASADPMLAHGNLQTPAPTRDWRRGFAAS